MKICYEYGLFYYLQKTPNQVINLQNRMMANSLTNCKSRSYLEVSIRFALY